MPVRDLQRTKYARRRDLDTASRTPMLFEFTPGKAGQNGQLGRLTPNWIALKCGPGWQPACIMFPT